MVMNFFRALSAKPSKEQQYSDGMLNWRADKSQCPKGKILLCGELSEKTRSIYEWAARQEAQVVLVNRASAHSAWLAATAEHSDFLIVDGDFMDDMEDTVELCLRIRRGIPGLKIILISDEVRGHDLTCERMSACDATLKGPATMQCLDLGAHVAIENHRKVTRPHPARSV